MKTAPVKQVKFDRETRDFAMYLNKKYIGSRSTYDAAEAELDRVALEQLTRSV